jgi:iron complex transport system ATP-binding protein
MAINSRDLNAIEIKQLNFSYGVDTNDEDTLKNISVNIEKGKFYTILGPNGSGKTTLIKLISKALNTKHEQIFMNDKDIININNRILAKKLAVVPQYSYMEFDFSVMDIVLMGRAPYISRFSSESEEDLEIVKNAMKMTSTWKLRDKSINELSGGERQMVIVARAIAQQTEIVLLDEPISNLDICHQIQILNQIKLINQKEKKTIIAVLHDLNIAIAYSDYIILMNNGRIHTMGSPEYVLKEDIIKKVYGIDVHIINDPISGRLVIIPII